VRIAVAGGTGTVGRHVVEAAQRKGHDVVVISRAMGIDVLATDTTSLSAALAEVEVIIDASNNASMNRAKATGWFTAATRNLQKAGAAAGVNRLVTISIVNIDKLAGNPYYAAKLAQEAAAKEGPLPVTILRATQFHEFSAQVMQRSRFGPVALVPRFTVQTVAARAVGEVAVELAESPPAPSEAQTDGGGDGPAVIVDLAGPTTASLVDQARAIVRRRGDRTRVIPFSIVGRTGRAMKTGGLTPGPGARVEGPAFEEWLAGPDIEAVAR
jgi:uncharacterized protein YbjT (DUF2867 family)